jgi:ribosomal protein S6--L-glutamate ligase
MKRQARPGEFRSNLHRGGSAEIVRLNAAETETAVRAAAVMGLSVAGVDLLRSRRGPLVLEVNSSPGLEGIEGATLRDVASAIIEYVEQRVKRRELRLRNHAVGIAAAKGNARRERRASAGNGTGNRK